MKNINSIVVCFFSLIISDVFAASMLRQQANSLNNAANNTNILSAANEGINQITSLFGSFAKLSDEVDEASNQITNSAEQISNRTKDSSQRLREQFGTKKNNTIDEFQDMTDKSNDKAQEPMPTSSKEAAKRLEKIKRKKAKLKEKFLEMQDELDNEEAKMIEIHDILSQKEELNEKGAQVLANMKRKQNTVKQRSNRQAPSKLPQRSQSRR